MTLICMMMVSCKPAEGEDPINPDGSDGKHEGHEYVDLGLSVKWATCNVGANKSEEYGNYYAWGETSPKEKYTKENSLTYGIQMSDISGNAQYDAATANWGGDWRMPTNYELGELRDECIWTWTMQNGVEGCNVKGPSGNSIFLPAAGGRDGTSLFDDGHGGYYWSSTPYDYDDYLAYFLDFNDGDEGVFISLRYYGLTVRPITE